MCSKISLGGGSGFCNVLCKGSRNVLVRCASRTCALRRFASVFGFQLILETHVFVCELTCENVHLL